MANATIAYFITNEQKKALLQYQLVADAIIEQLTEGNTVSGEGLNLYLKARDELCEFFSELQVNEKLPPSSLRDEEIQLEFCKNIEKKFNQVLTEKEQADNFYGSYR